jgi:hypothetical protein
MSEISRFVQNSSSSWSYDERLAPPGAQPAMLWPWRRLVCGLMTDLRSGGCG